MRCHLYLCRQFLILGAIQLILKAIFKDYYRSPLSHVTLFPIPFSWVVTLSLTPPPLARDVLSERPLILIL